MHRKQYHLLVVATLFILFGLSLSGFQFDQTDTELPAQSKGVQVRELLSEEGVKSGTTFTIEEAILKGGKLDRIRSFRRPTPPAGTHLTALLDDLSQSIPNFTWYADPNNPKIIHVVDSQLLHWKGYALDRNIDEIHFTGTVSGLVEAIAAKGVPVSAVGTFDTQALAFTDFASKVQVDGTNLKVRDALSDFIPLRGRGPILWFAETHIDGSDTTSYIRFQGAPPRTRTPSQ